MNFMSGRPGFYEDITSTNTTTAMSSSSSSPSHHKSLPLYTYHRHQEPYASGSGGAPPPQPPDNNSDDHMCTTTPQSHVPIEREHMFDKVVTPSDVGKLNRLVIPKQHAEKYFPLDSSANEKGLLLNFEDRNGKPWRFRYSYWNSSQSYVMTKGWSRFVKEKKLDAGDIVSFQRGTGELSKDRLFIDWRRRPDAPDLPPSLSIPHQFSFQRSSIHPWNPLYLHPPPSQHHQPYGGYGGHSYGFHSSNVVNGSPCPPGSIVYLRPGGGGVYAPQRAGISGPEEQMVYESVPVVQGKAAAKRLRLFGVNMDCPISETDECDHHILPSTTLPTHCSTMPFIDHMSSSDGLMGPPQYPSFRSSDSPSSSSSIPYLQLGPNYNDQSDDDKGKGSMSLDLDI